MNTLGKLFLQGLAVVIPAALTGAILWWFARGAEQILGGLLKSFLPAGWYIPGMGVVSGIAMTILVGLLTHVILFQKLFALGDSILNRLPLVKTIYSALQDFIDYLRPDSKVAMSKVVLVKVPGQQFEQLGFVTREDFSSLPLTLTVEDPLFLREPASYSTRWLPAREGYKLQPYECNAEDARRAVKYMVPKYR